MVNTKIRLIIFLAAKDGEALCSQQKQDQELTVAQTMNSLLPNSLKLKKVGKTTTTFMYDLKKISHDWSNYETKTGIRLKKNKNKVSKSNFNKLINSLTRKNDSSFD